MRKILTILACLLWVTSAWSYDFNFLTNAETLFVQGNSMNLSGTWSKPDSIRLRVYQNRTEVADNIYGYGSTHVDSFDTQAGHDAIGIHINFDSLDGATTEGIYQLYTDFKKNGQDTTAWTAHYSIKVGYPDVNIAQISGDGTVADNLEEILDGDATGADFRIDSARANTFVVSSAGTAVLFEATGAAAHGLKVKGGTSGSGLHAEGGNAGRGIHCLGYGVGAGLHALANGANAPGVKFDAGAGGKDIDAEIVPSDTTKTGDTLAVKSDSLIFQGAASGLDSTLVDKIMDLAMAAYGVNSGKTGYSLASGGLSAVVTWALIDSLADTIWVNTKFVAVIDSLGDTTWFKSHGDANWATSDGDTNQVTFPTFFVDLNIRSDGAVLVQDTVADGDSIITQSDTSACQGSASGLTAAEVGDTLTNRGLSTGGGTEAETLIVFNAADTTVIQDARPQVYTLDQSTGKVTSLTTDVNGVLICFLGDGVGTDSFFVRTTATGYTQITDTIAVVSGGGTDSLWMTAFNPGSPASPDVCTVYGWILDVSGDSLSGVDVSVEISEDYHPVKYGTVTITPFEVSDTTSSSGYWAIDLIRTAQLSDTTTQYIFTITNEDGSIRTVTAKVPDQDNWEMQE